MDAREYIRKTDELIRDLRNKQLGLNRQLDDLLPPQLICAETEVKARYLANRLLFMLLRNGDGDGGEWNIEEVYSWLYEVSLYMFERSPWEEQTFSGFLKMIGLPFGVRTILFGRIEKDPRYKYLREDPSCPFKKGELEAVFVEFSSPIECEKKIIELKLLIDSLAK